MEVLRKSADFLLQLDALRPNTISEYETRPGVRPASNARPMVSRRFRAGKEYMTSTETRHRIAVFIDFDNVEIGVKSTIGGQFDIGLVLEAIKERGEIVTKIAYSDWKRAGDYSRLLTQHAIRMVQRNLTPGGDKNGADITMALDALEMAFTHDHINAFVIVGGDRDFISLVEKLKQYRRKVIVVGGRQFTSVTMQKNCHEFIAYENLVGSRGRPTERGGGRPRQARSRKRCRSSSVRSRCCPNAKSRRSSDCSRARCCSSIRRSPNGSTVPAVSATSWRR